MPSTNSGGVPIMLGTDPVSAIDDYTVSLGTFIQTTPGLHLLNTTTVSSGSTLTINNIFSSSYEAYRIEYSCKLTGTTLTQDLQLQLVDAGGTPSSTTVYQFNNTRTTNTTAPARSSSGGAASWSGMLSGDFWGHGFVDIIRPNVADYTLANGLTASWATSESQATTFQGFHYVQSAYTGIKLTPQAGTFAAGTFRIYGYRN